MKIASVISGLLLFCATSVCGQTVGEVVSNDTDLSTLYAAAEIAGFDESMGTVEMTLFAPTNDAFASVDQALLDLLLTPPWLIHLRALLSEHIVLGSIPSSNITDGMIVDSEAAIFSALGVSPITFTVNDGGIFVSGLAFTDSQVIEGDIFATNGVVHKVNQVFVPQMISRTIWDGLQELPEGFEIFKSLVLATGLNSLLDGSDPITVLPVPDEVIEAVPDGALDTVNMTEVILNHIIAGVIPSTSISDGMEVVTLLGTAYAFTILDDGTILIGDVEIIRPNLLASNGIAHVIGGILSPSMMTPPTTTAPTMTPVTTETSAPTVLGATDAASSAGFLMAFAAIAATVFLL